MLCCIASKSEGETRGNACVSCSMCACLDPCFSDREIIAVFFSKSMVKFEERGSELLSRLLRTAVKTLVSELYL